MAEENNNKKIYRIPDSVWKMYKSVIPAFKPDNKINGAIYGWVCPRCGKVNAPWVLSCDCKQDGNPGWVMPYLDHEMTNEESKKIFGELQVFDNLKNEDYLPSACLSCPNNPKNGGSGICNCVLGDISINCIANGQ